MANAPSSPPLTYFYCSWPDFRIAKQDKPLIQFEGRFLKTSDSKLVLHIRDMAKSLKGAPITLKEIPAHQYGMEDTVVEQKAEETKPPE